MPQEPNTTALETVLEYHRSWTSGEIDRAMALVTDDFVCQTPGGPLGKTAYRDYLANFVPRLTGIGDIAQFSEGERVVLIYYPQTAVTPTTPAAEYFTVEGGFIASSLLMFDRQSYAPPGGPSSS